MENLPFGNHGSSLKPCPNNINCLMQYSEEKAKYHNSIYSHPCCYSELCRRNEPYLTHEPHLVSTCKYDTICSKKSDPLHRATYRHTDMPDFLKPCPRRENCQNKSINHRTKFSHGEQVYKTLAVPEVEGKR
jgi:hypothetical protein